ncbi:energy-coupling factor ABC transporter ATP-binding protein [Pyrococcus abyssi]|uniref:Putative ABC transporter ATP-binding protein PYRAB01300 n=1 Tax=Pyrococcus abyssi (strain GE5 / Orsay) TaxID=272844 RepID=Y130_PYRAB|nr:energy-coupling factor ABC transporter ATP-binding protein [Pyrococcus abyssi]Q9V2E4.1 RecName: Full=Putative ABC transporter ATP-binding protein PYRAB01300 [Pyrococcus abyssi GE5]CAB49054.1 ABC transporter, ATP-binding protein, substrate unknown [Pyrococcus abyssi GE5]CCE69506.1 TPA: cobalt ABC transporter, ATP-binding protein [Pyrococcus abyssi GE5]
MIEFKDVWFWYDDGKYVLKSINFRFKGGTLAIVGPNGSGKTTLVKMMNGLLKPKKGDVIIDGINTRDKSVAEMSRLVGYVFQNPDAMFFEENVFKEVAFGPRNLGLSEEEVEKRVRWALREVGLEGFEDRSPLELSGGEKQRLAIACILAMKPKYLVLDEPNTGLDERGLRGLINVIRKLREDNHSIILVTHDMELVLEVADEVLLLKDGEIKFFGPVEDFFKLDLRNFSLVEPEIIKIAKELKLRFVRNVDELIKVIGL